MKWLLFLSQLPTNPSSLRVTVWRKMRAEGAHGLQNGVWILPDNSEQTLFLQELSEMVQKQGAGCQIFNVSPLSDTVEQDILQRFIDDRAEEYVELKEQCAKFLTELGKEVQRHNFSFAEYEENEQDLTKLESWLGRISHRDFLGGDHAREAEEWLQKCREKFQDFTSQVFASEDHNHAQTMEYDPGSVNDQPCENPNHTDQPEEDESTESPEKTP